MMRRILLLLFVIGLTASTTVMAGMSTSKVRKETRFLTDKMAYELSLSTPQYNDVYEINYDFIYSVRNIMDYVVRGEEWALDDYYEALDIRNDDLRWVMSDAQYRRFLGAEYFYRPIYVNGGRWNFRVYVNYPNRSLFYFGVPYHYRTYCGAHYRPHIHHVSFYRGRYTNFNHYATPHRVRDQRVFHSYRRSDFGSVRFRPNTSTRPHNAPTRPGVGRPGKPSRPNTPSRPGNSSRPRPGSDHKPSGRPSNTDRPSGRPSNTDRPSGRPSNTDRPSTRPSTPSRNDKPNKETTPGRTPSRRPETTTGSSNSSRRPSSGSTSTGSSRGNSTSNSSTVRQGSSSSSRNSDRSNSSSSRGSSSSRSNSPSRSNSSGRSTSTQSSSSSSRGNVSTRQPEKRSSSESSRSNSSRSSSRSSDRENGSRR